MLGQGCLGRDARAGMSAGVDVLLGRRAVEVAFPLLALAALLLRRRETFPCVPSLFVLGVDGRIRSSLPPRRSSCSGVAPSLFRAREFSKVHVKEAAACPKRAT